MKCSECGTVYPLDGDAQSVCPDCDPRFGTLDCLFDYEIVGELLARKKLQSRRDMSIFRYEELLPVKDPAYHVPLHIGWTPVYTSPTAAAVTGLSNVAIKDDGLNPTGSSKDRASAMVVARAMELDYDAVCTASTGNAAASLAACCRSVGMPCIVLVPAATPTAKLLQMLAFGAHVIPVDGSYDQAFELAVRACEAFGWMNRSAGYNPYLVEGKKTLAWELGEQMQFDLPHAVFVSVGDGSIISGICKGFEEQLHLGFIDHVPRVYGVQAEGAPVLADAWEHMLETGRCDFTPMAGSATVADSINVGYPREGIRALRSVKATGGAFITVSDALILKAMETMPLETAVFGEPAAAAAYAGMKKSVETGLLNKSQSAAVFITGSGLKDTRTAASVWSSSGQAIPVSDDALEIIKHRIQSDEKC